MFVNKKKCMFVYNKNSCVTFPYLPKKCFLAPNVGSNIFGNLDKLENLDKIQYLQIRQINFAILTKYVVVCETEKVTAEKRLWWEESIGWFPQANPSQRRKKPICFPR